MEPRQMSGEDEQFLRDLLSVDQTERRQASPGRIERVLAQSRREVAARDLIRFGGARIWQVLLLLSAAPCARVAEAWSSGGIGV